MLQLFQKNKFPLISSLLSFCLCALLSGCVTIYNPATQKRETLLYDTESEVALGSNMTREVEKKYPLLADNRMQTRLNSIGQRIAKASDRQDLSYSFKIVNDKELNAFALPGGFVYVNSGLLNASTDDELAGVLAHEVGHIAARHSIKSLQSALGYQLILGIALGASGQKTLSDAMDVIFNLVSLGYSRKDELLADRLSVKYASKAGFNPRGMISFFRKLQKDSEARGSHYNPVFLSSHPSIEERIKNIESILSESIS